MPVIAGMASAPTAMGSGTGTLTVPLV